MEIVSIDKETFDALIDRIERLANTAKLLTTQPSKGVGVLLDNSDVCRILNISKRTLHTYRTNGTIPYKRIEKKIYYDPKDIEKVIESSKKITSDD